MNVLNHSCVNFFFLQQIIVNHLTVKVHLITIASLYHLMVPVWNYFSLCKFQDRHSLESIALVAI